MQPFQEFRYWLRRGPGSERAATGIAAALVLALLAWLLVPGGDGSSEDVVSVGGSATDTGAGAERPAQTASPAGGDPSDTGVVAPPASTGPISASPGETASGSSQTATGTSECVSPPGSAKGISRNEVKIAVGLTEIVGPAANSVFNIPPPEEAQADFEAVIAGINREGGIACRKVVAQYIKVNPVDEARMMQVCREVGDSDVFAMVDTGGLATNSAVQACFGQRKIPFISTFFLAEKFRQQFFPYLYSNATRELLYRNTVTGLREIGFFEPSKGFQKLGFIYRSCQPESINTFRVAIRAAGVPDDRVVIYDVGCPAAFSNPADLQQAILLFRREGVTHVTTGNFTGDIANFTNNAERQGFRPKYGFPDESLLNIAEGSQAPNPDNIANAVAISLGRQGEQNTPGMSPTAGTQRCNAYHAAAGQPPVYEQPANAGQACGQLWILQAGLGKAPELSPLGLAIGLQRAKSIEFSFPQGPNDFSGDRVTTGGQFWRVAQFLPSCRCWQVVQKDFRRGPS